MNKILLNHQDAKGAKNHTSRFLATDLTDTTDLFCPRISTMKVG